MLFSMLFMFIYVILCNTGTTVPCLLKATWVEFYSTKKSDNARYTNCTTDDVDTSQILAVLSPDTVSICRLSGLTQTCMMSTHRIINYWHPQPEKCSIQCNLSIMNSTSTILLLVSYFSWIWLTKKCICKIKYTESLWWLCCKGFTTAQYILQKYFT